MIRTVREASSRVVARVVGSRFAKPIARVALAAAGLLLLAFIGKTALAGALGSAPLTAAAPAASAGPLASVPPPPPSPVPVLPSTPAAAVTSPAPAIEASPVSRTRATADDPVVLNTATVDDFRRLPGVGEKRATAALAVRTRLGGRFHAIEDLLKVKGIGRTTLRRLRPLVRLDPAPLPEAGVAAPR
jgi:competence protein ComEA